MTLPVEIQTDFIVDFARLAKYGPQRAISEIERSAVGQMQEAARAIRRAIARGDNIADGMRDFFHPILIDAARAGELSGNLLDAVLKQHASLTKIRSTLRSPILTFLAAIGLIIFISIAFIPAISEFVPRHKLPFMGKLVFGLGEGVKTWGAPIGVLLAAVCAWTSWSLANFIGEPRKLLDRFPPWSIYREFQAAMQMLYLCLYLRNGVKLEASLLHLARQANPYIGSHLRSMRRNLANPQGRSTAAALDTGLIGQSEMRRFLLMEDAEDFESALKESAERYLERVTKRLDRLGKRIEFVVKILTSALVAVMILGIMQTMLSVGMTR